MARVKAPARRHMSYNRVVVTDMYSQMWRYDVVEQVWRPLTPQPRREYPTARAVREPLKKKLRYQ